MDVNIYAFEILLQIHCHHHQYAGDWQLETGNRDWDIIAATHFYCYFVREFGGPVDERGRGQVPLRRKFGTVA